MQLGFKNGILIANPISKKYEIPFKEMEKTILNAIQTADKKGISGKEVTPFLLSKIVELTKGRSLQTNIKLVENNVKLACEIAKQM